MKLIKQYFVKRLTGIPMIANSVVGSLLMRLGIVGDYQPTEFGMQTIRECSDRLSAIKENIVRSSLCLDIGCNTGFFAHEIAKTGTFTLGLDFEPKNVIVAKSLYSRANLCFKEFKLEINSVDCLPTADTILFLSVFHHLVKYFGSDSALKILESIATKCNKQLFFETGQPNEVGAKWRELMGFVNDVEEWSHEFFVNQCGYREVRCLGAFETTVGKIKRKLLVANR